MAGNVWEWTASRWETDSEVRVLRGGAFGISADYARAPSRDWDIGLRVAAAPFSPRSEL
jgi:formylglycine-generating enzyme required for sulfatase activity